jgi:RNA polymerase sigma-70 factor (ECF subfamily)
VLRGATESCSTATNAEDAQLICQLCAGDHDALATLYHRHAAGLLSYLRRFLDQPEIAEEVLQDTFLSAWRSARSFIGRSTVRVWLLGIARRQAMNRLRRDGAVPPLIPLEDEEVATADDPAALVQAQLDREELTAAVRTLSPLHREVLSLLLVDQLSYAEIAAVLDVPIGTVRSRVSNARHRLAAQLRAARSERDE